MANEAFWKKMSDLTIIFLTFNKVPKDWARFHRRVLTKAIGDKPIITITKEPTDWGLNLIQTEYGMENLFKQILRGAETATTPYVAIAEDDVLYDKSHFNFRPPLDKIAYDLHRFEMFSWGRPFYFHKPNICNAGMIAPRELLITAIKERLSHRNPLYKEIGRNDWEKSYRVTQYQVVTYYGKYPYLGIKHDYSVDIQQQNHTKRPWPVQAYEIPKWGKAEEIITKFI